MDGNLPLQSSQEAKDNLDEATNKADAVTKSIDELYSQSERYKILG